MRPSRLFTSDIDGTLIAPDRDDDRAVRAFRTWREGNPDVVVAYVTGRSLASALEVIEASGLPRPDAIGSAVGTSVHWWRGGLWENDASYATRLATSLGGSSLESVDALVLAHDGVRRQDEHEQGRFKRSFERESGAFDPDTIARIRRDLDSRFMRTNLITSVDPWTGHGLIDVLPRDTDKARAVEHLRARTGLPVESVVFAGDSGNDLAALSRPWWSIVVGNASADVLAHFRPGLDRERRSVQVEGTVLRGVLEGLDAIGWRRDGASD